MRDRESKGRALATVAAVALSLGIGTTVSAQTTSTDTVPQQQYGDSESLSSGTPITAPNTVDAGQLVNIVVEGAPQGSRIQLWGPVGEPGAASQLAEVPLTGGVAALTAPDASGSYELRYVDASGKQRGRRAFDVSAAPVALKVPMQVGKGGVIDVTWQGPAQPGDRLEIVSASGAVVGSAAVAGNPGGENVSPVTAPQEPGHYSLRYVTAGGSVLRSVGFDVR